MGRPSKSPHFFQRPATGTALWGSFNLIGKELTNETRALLLFLIKQCSKIHPQFLAILPAFLQHLRSPGSNAPSDL